MDASARVPWRGCLSVDGFAAQNLPCLCHGAVYCAINLVADFLKIIFAFLLFVFSVPDCQIFLLFRVVTVSYPKIIELNIDHFVFP